MGHETDDERMQRRPAAETEEAPQRQDDTKDVQRSPAWSPGRRAASTSGATTAASMNHARPDEGDGAQAPSDPASPPTPDEVEIALLGDAGFVPPQRPRGGPADLAMFEDAPPDPERMAQARSIQARVPPGPRAPLDPGAWIATHHLGPFARALHHHVPVGPPFDAGTLHPARLARATATRARFDLDRLAMIQLALHAHGASAAVRIAMRDTLPSRLDAMELALQRAGDPVSQASPLLLDIASHSPRARSGDPSPEDLAWWDEALAIPHGGRWSLSASSETEEPQAARQAIAWRGVELYRANLRLRTRYAAAVRAVADADGSSSAAALVPAASTLDRVGAAVGQGLRALGRGLHADVPLDPPEALMALGTLGGHHERARQHAILALARQLPTPLPIDATRPADPAILAAAHALCSGTDPDALDAVAHLHGAVRAAAWWTHPRDDQGALALLETLIRDGHHGAATLHAQAYATAL